MKDTKREWKKPNASEKYQMRVKNIKRGWKIPNVSEKYQSRVKNTKREWKIPNATEKYKTQVKSTKRVWKISNATEKYQTRVKSTKRDIRDVSWRPLPYTSLILHVFFSILLVTNDKSRYSGQITKLLIAIPIISVTIHMLSNGKMKARSLIGLSRVTRCRDTRDTCISPSL